LFLNTDSCRKCIYNLCILDVPGLTDKEKVRQLQAEVLDFLEYHLSGK